MGKSAGAIDIILGIWNIAVAAVVLVFVHGKLTNIKGILIFNLFLGIVMLITGIWLVTTEHIIPYIFSWVYAILLIGYNIATLNIFSIALWMSLIKVKLLIR